MKATVIGFDIKKYSGSENVDEMDSKRDMFRNTLQTCIQKYPEIERGFNNIGTPDTGDGCYIVIDSGNFENIISFLEDVKSILTNQNTIRLRAAVHRDTVKETKSMNGQSKTWIGDGVNNCARNLDSEPLKTLIDINETENFVYGLSSDFYNELVNENNYPNKFDSFDFRTKEYVSKIYLNIENIANTPEKKALPEIVNFEISDTHKEFLEKSDFVYPDKSKPNTLSTFFVYPYLLYQKISRKNLSKIDSKDLINDYLTYKGKLLILGGDQTGKTSLAKKYFLNIFESHKFFPVYISCKKGVPKLYENLIAENFKHQYKQTYTKELKDYIVLILDNFNLWNDTQQEKFINNLSDDSNVIIFANSIFNESLEKRNLLKEFSQYEIKTLGHEKRAELINKWIEYIDDKNENQNYKLFDELNQFVNQTLLSGLIPYTPFYILTILVAKKDYAENPNDQITSKARCYKMLVDLQLKYININDQEIPNYRTIFSFIAYQLFSKKREYFSYEELKQVIFDYKKEYTINGTPEELIEIFNQSSIFNLETGFGQYTFSYKYSYYYFLGKYIADNYSEDEEIKTIALSFLDALYEKENYYISIFIIHHLKDVSYFNEVCTRAELLYKDYPEAKLTNDEFVQLEEEYKNTEELIISSLDNSKTKRLEDAKAKDRYEEKNNTEDYSPVEATKEIQQTIRIVELLGQIVKNNGQLKTSKLTQYYLVGVNTYKRVCTYFLSTFKKYKNEFIELIKENIEKQGPLGIGDTKAQAYAMFAKMNFISAYATIYRISDALSANHLMTELIKPALEQDPNPMNFCIYVHGLMWYMKQLPYDDMKNEFSNLPDDVQFLIKAFLQDYTDKHHIKIADREKLAKTFKMELSQLEYDNTK